MVKDPSPITMLNSTDFTKQKGFHVETFTLDSPQTKPVMFVTKLPVLLGKLPHSHGVSAEGLGLPLSASAWAGPGELRTKDWPEIHLLATMFITSAGVVQFPAPCLEGSELPGLQ